MKMCQLHWVALRDAIEMRGLSGFVSKDGQTAIDRTVNDLHGAPATQTFDPLMAANFAIWSNALDQGGLYLMQGDCCPICESEKHGGPTAEWWIANAAQEQLNKARELGLLPPDRPN